MHTHMHTLVSSAYLGLYVPVSKTVGLLKRKRIMSFFINTDYLERRVLNIVLCVFKQRNRRCFRRTHKSTNPLHFHESYRSNYRLRYCNVSDPVRFRIHYPPGTTLKNRQDCEF